MHAAGLLLAIATSAHAGYACVDPADATARRWFQDEPCQLPMFHWPLPGNSGIGETTRWGRFQASDPSAQAGHAFFWRFPVQGYPPHGAPSVGAWRSGR
jgi:hypothetical protein